MIERNKNTNHSIIMIAIIVRVAFISVNKTMLSHERFMKLHIFASNLAQLITT